MAQPANALGTILAGGESRRYGSQKALASVDGVRLVDRVARAMGRAVGRVVLIANDIEACAHLGLPVRPDARPGTGVLGGICTAVRWAREEGFDVALVTACDMPFLSPALLSELVQTGGRDIIAVPESHSRRGFEPLCAVYGVGCLPDIEASLDRGDRAVVSFFPAVEVRRLELEAVRRHGDPSTLFMNVNRPDDRARAESLLSGGAGAPPAVATPPTGSKGTRASDESVQAPSTEEPSGGKTSG